MEAPDKVFLDIIEDEDIHMIAPSYENNGGVEYIRKDALTEWANKRLEEFRHIAEISKDAAADGEVDAFEELLNKLHEM